MLPGLDDGAPDEATSMAMLKGLVALGFDTICATPHQKHGQFLPELTAIRDAHAATRSRLAANSVEVELALGAENMWDSVFYERMFGANIPSYNYGPAFLLEFRLAADFPIKLESHLFGLRARGKLPVIAHPERYQPLWKDHALI